MFEVARIHFLSDVFAAVAVVVALGTLRSDNGDVHENVAEKKTSHHFKFFAIIAICPVT